MSPAAAAQAHSTQLNPQDRQASEADHQNLHLIPAPAVKHRWIWRVVQWKYNVDATSKWLKRLYFHYVFLPFNEFSYWAFDLLPPNGRDDTGRLCWTEDQGCWETEWEAEQEARRYQFGHAIRVSLNARLPAETVNTEQIHPHSTPEVRRMYAGKTVSPTIEVPRLDVVKLAAKLAQSDRIFQTRVP